MSLHCQPRRDLLLKQHRVSIDPDSISFLAVIFVAISDLVFAKSTIELGQIQADGEEQNGDGAAALASSWGAPTFRSDATRDGAAAKAVLPCSRGWFTGFHPGQWIRIGCGSRA